jgi:hypothetical protein
MLVAALLVPVNIVLSFALATWAEHHKKTGFWWTFGFSLILTPVIGYLFARLKKDQPGI